MRRKLEHKNYGHYPCCRFKGLTLTDVVVASALLAVSIVPMLRGLTGSHMTSTAIEHKTQSLILAKSKMEEIKARCAGDYSISFGENNVSLDASFYGNVSDSAEGTDLRVIEVSAGYDIDGDSVLDTDEIDAVLSTKIARRD